jgi:hypothetical protein
MRSAQNGQMLVGKRARNRRLGMKCRNPLSPKTIKRKPSKTRAMSMAIFMVFPVFSLGRSWQLPLVISILFADKIFAFENIERESFSVVRIFWEKGRQTQK